MINTFIPLSKNKPTQWFLIDADGQNLGRLSTQVANILQGKNQVTYTPGSDSKTYVIIVNASKIKVTGKKSTQKLYYSHTGKPGELKIRSFTDLLNNKPEKILEVAIKRMLPNGFAKSGLSKRLRVYSSSQHPHTSQQPQTVEFSNMI
jgi:large subunit ribosomal protein L13